MKTIHYKLTDGHMEEIKVTEEVTAAFEQWEKNVKYKRAFLFENH